jgi:predicted HTH transcriptional regulator
MDKQGLSEIIGRGREQPGVEFKAGGSRKDKRLLAKVIRAVIGMANRRDGGCVIIGIQENERGAPMPNGISSEDLVTWSYDDLADSLAQYVDPTVNFDLEAIESDGKTFVVILVQEFEDIPVLCKKDYPDVLRAGACYVRTRRKPETLEVPTQVDMRDLLELAIDKGIRRFVTRARAGGLDLLGRFPPTDADLFNKQIEDLLY